MINPYESPIGDAEPQQFRDIERIPRGEQLGLGFGLLFSLALALVVVAEWQSIEVNLHHHTISATLGLLPIVSSALGVAALPLCVWRKWQRSDKFPKLLGHWLLLIAGVSWLSGQCFGIWNARVWRDHDLLTSSGVISPDPTNNLNLVQAFFLLAASVVHWIAFRALRGDLLSQAYLLAGIIGLYWIGLTPMFTTLSIETSGMMMAPLAIILLVLFCWIFVRDLLKRRERDAMHWAGIASMFLPLAASLVNVCVALRQYIAIYSLS